MNTGTRWLRRFAVSVVLGAGLARAAEPAVAARSEPLGSWNDGPAKRAILDFVSRVTGPGGPDFVPPAQRIAVFDNDGTLWAEQPAYFQLLFAVDRVKALAPQHPEWKEQQPFAALLEGDMAGALAGGEHALAEIVGATHSGMTPEEFEDVVKRWLATAKHPRFDRPYTDLVYQPMLELLAHLREHGFKTFIVSAGGIEFMRAFAEAVYGIPPEQVIGSTGQQKFEPGDGRPVLRKLPGVDFVNDGEGKPIGIQRFVGRRPLAAFGNSDGDLPMLQWTAAGSGSRFCLYVRHTDGEREWAYDRTSRIGRLDRGLDVARARGWTIVSVKDDWKRVFAFEAVASGAR